MRPQAAIPSAQSQALGVPKFILQRSVMQWVAIAFIARLFVMLLIHFTGVEKSMSLTKDAFLYDRVGVEMAQYFRTGNPNDWPVRVTGPVDFSWEYVVGVTYYLFGHMPLIVKFLCVLAGTAVPYVYYRTAQHVTQDEGIARCVLVTAAFFPTQIYYSGLMVRDSVATLAMAILFLGVAELVTGASKTWWVRLGIGLLMMIGLRSYVASLLAIVIPGGFILTAMAGSTVKGGSIRAIIAALVLAAGVMLALFLAPDLVAELDMQYTDLDYINKIRNKMNSGSGAMFRGGGVTEIGGSITDTLVSVGVGIYYFFFSLNPTSIGSFRQVMALPEVLLVAVGTIFAFKGFRILWKTRRSVLLPVLIPTLVLTLGYSAATTNGGPLMRWRMQLIGIYLIMAVAGWIMSRRKKAMAGGYPRFRQEPVPG